MPQFTTIQSKALNLLARRDYSYQEIFNKISSKGFEPDKIRAELQELVTRNWIDDNRLAENLIRAYQDYKGISWLKQKMQQRGLKPETIEVAISNWQEAEDERTDLKDLKQKVACKYKITDWNNLEWDLKQKIFAFLARSGFTNASQILRKWQEEL